MDCRVISAFTRVFDALCPAMTNAGAPYSYLTMSNSPIQRSAARRGASSPRVGVERGGEPRRRGQRDELRVDIRLRGRNGGAYHCAVVAHEKFERLPERAVRPADGHSLAIAQRGEIGGLDRGALGFPFPHRLDDLMQPCPTLRLGARFGFRSSPRKRGPRIPAYAGMSGIMRWHRTTPPRSRGAFLRPGFAPLLRSSGIEGWAERRETFGCQRAPVGRAILRQRRA